MAETITPVVHEGKRKPYVLASLLHVVGATASAGLLGLALGGLGALAGAPWDPATTALVVTVAAVYCAREVFGLRLPLPNLERQVPEWWRTFFSPPIAALLYGMGLGVGFLTYLSYGTFAAVLVAAVASGDPVAGLVLCAPFGAARGLAVVAATWRSGPGALDRLDDLAQTRLPRLANAGALAAVAAAALL